MRLNWLRLSYFFGTPALLICILYLNACKHETDIDSLPEVCFVQQVLPIFQLSCGLSGCHDATTANAGMVLLDYEDILSGVTPGDAQKSKIYKSIINIWSNEMMPPNHPLSQEDRTFIRVWIEQGARHTVCPDTTTLVHFSVTTKIKISQKI